MSRWPRAMPSCARAPCFLCRTMPVHLSRAGPLCLSIVLARRRCLPHGAVPSSTIRDAVSRTDEPRRLVGGDGGGRQSLLQRHARSLRGATGTGRQAFPAPSGPASQSRGQTSRGGKKCHGLRLGGVFWRSIPPSGHGGGSHPPRDLHTQFPALTTTTPRRFGHAALGPRPGPPRLCPSAEQAAATRRRMDGGRRRNLARCGRRRGRERAEASQATQATQSHGACRGDSGARAVVSTRPGPGPARRQHAS